MSTRLVLLHNVKEEANLSMKLYADRVASALGSRCAVEHVYPWPKTRGWYGSPPIVSKGLEYVARYVVYPLTLLGRRSDVFHIVDHSYAHLLSCLPARRTVITCHDLMLLKLASGEFGASTRLPRMALWFFRHSVDFLRRAALVLADSRATAADLVTHLGIRPEKVRVIYPGIDSVFAPSPDCGVRAEARSRFGLDGHPVLLHVGNNMFYKNLEGVLRAVAMLSSFGWHALLLKIGQALSPTQRALARVLGIEDQVREFGRISNEELRAAYWAADVLIFPSLWEGFGWPVLEAMACGTPVVCSAKGALGEVANGAAAVVDPNDPRGIADAIAQVLSDKPFRLRLVEAGLERAQQFTWERAAKQMYEVYETVAGAASAGR